MRRRIARGFFVLFCGALATALGVVTALLYTGPGRSLLARLLSEWAPRLVRGSVTFGAVRGRWVDGFTLDSVVITDTAGVALVRAGQVEVHYSLANLLARRIVLSSAAIRRAEVQILKHRSGRVNYEEIFRLGESQGGGASPLVEIHNLRIEDSRLTIRLPWNPDGRLRTGAQVDSALAYQRAVPGRRIETGPEGLEQIRTLEPLTADIERLRLATPDDQPLLLRIRRLSTRINDPLLDIRDLAAELTTKHDSLRFALDKALLPGTELRGAGRLDWPRDTILYRFGLEARKLALADLRFISPSFPDFTGTGRVQARSLSGALTEFDLRDLSVGDPGSRVTGRLVAITDLYRGLGFRGLDLSLANLDLDVPRAFLDTLPFHGRITGRLQADGFFDSMKVSLDWAFHDSAVPGGAETRVVLDGPLTLGGDQGIVFHDAELVESDVDLRTVRVIAPAVTLNGRLGLRGRLDGPLKNATFNGNAEHRDGDHPASHLVGAVRLDTRGAVLGLSTDVVLDSLVFDGIRPSFPSLPTRGALGGRLKLDGTLEHLHVDANLGGGLGRVTALGGVILSPPGYGADSLRLSFSRLDLAAVTGRGPGTMLLGSATVTARADSARAPEGRAEVVLEAGRLGGYLIDSAAARIRVTDSVIVVDTARVDWVGGRVEGGGKIGWAAPRTGELRLHASVADLSGLDSLLRGGTGLVPDSTKGEGPLAGRASGDVTLRGSLDALQVEGEATAESVRWLGYQAASVLAKVHWAAADSAVDAAVTVDSLHAGRLAFPRVAATGRGTLGSLRWWLDGAGPERGQLHASGTFRQAAGERRIGADTLVLGLEGREWRLTHPAEARWLQNAIELDTVRLATGDGSGSIEVGGTIPREGEARGGVRITALGIELKDLYGIAQADTSGIAGTLALDAQVSGSTRRPELRGSAALTGGVFGDFSAPLVRAAFDYREQMLRSNVTFWRTGKSVMEVDVGLPLDLALQSVPRRQLPGPISIVARGDSIDLAIAEAFTSNLRRVTGVLDVDASVKGTWESPQLSGEIRVRDGSALVPALGARYHSVAGTLRLTSSLIMAEGITVGSTTGTMTVAGGIFLQRLTSPILALTLSTRDFELLDVPDYMSLRTRGEVQLSGPIRRPVLTGKVRLSNSVIYFADLIQKDIVNLDDPLYRDLVDTTAIRKFKLGANFQSRFFDSLTVRDLDVEVGEGVWLRSNEANFQLEGSVRVNKVRNDYMLAGTLDTPRGAYTLKVGGLINRTFTVDRGTVRYFDNLNAQLDVQARHVVRNPQSGGEDLPVIAHITGTLAVPKLTLTTPPDRPPMSQPELISLLMVGSTNPAAVTSQFRAQTAAAFAANLLSSELQRAIVSGRGGQAPDIVEIRPGIATGGAIAGSTSALTQLAIGWALTSKLFVTANAGFCFVSGQATLSTRYLGANLEYRFRRDLRAQLTAEPVQSCLLHGVDVFGTSKRYQFGAELRWDRDY